MVGGCKKAAFYSAAFLFKRLRVTVRCHIERSRDVLTLLMSSSRLRSN